MATVKNFVKKTMKRIVGLQRECTQQPRKEVPFANWLKQIGIQTILDVGAHKGESVRRFHKMLPEATIYSFEPQRDCFAELERLTKVLSNFQAFNVALGDQNETQPLYRSNYSPSSSLLPMGKLHKENFPHTTHITSDKTVEVRRLDDVVKELDLRERVLLKMDAQGYENKVLKGGLVTLSKISVIITEVLFQSLYEGQACFADIYDIVSHYGFMFCGVTNPGRKNPKNGIPLFSDVLFVRKELLM